MTKSWRAGCARALAASCLALILLAFAGLPASANSIDRHAFVGHVRTARAVVNHLGPTRSIYVSPSGKRPESRHGQASATSPPVCS